MRILALSQHKISEYFIIAIVSQVINNHYCVIKYCFTVSCLLSSMPIQTYHSRTGFEPLDFRKSRDLSPPLWAATWAAAARLLQLLLKNPFPEGPPRPGPLGPPPSIKAVVAVSLSLKSKMANLYTFINYFPKC